MPLKILGSLIMLTALILIGNPSCELEEKRYSEQSQLVLVKRLTCDLCAYVNIRHLAVNTTINGQCSRATVNNHDNVFFFIFTAVSVLNNMTV